MPANRRLRSPHLLLLSLSLPHRPHTTYCASSPVVCSRSLAARAVPRPTSRAQSAPSPPLASSPAQRRSAAAHRGV
eukprot:6176322-Pleurochrysis_carterae.AAC.3